MKFLFLEPFFGGSHKDFANGLSAHSAHRIDLVTLPARFWKWRMRGAALYFINQVPDLAGYDGLITTDLMSLSDFKALSTGKCPPALVYFHENQLTYPLAPGESIDYQFGFTDITTALAADKILFNSHTHFEAFFASLPGFINKMPEFKPLWAIEAIKAKSSVLYPGCEFPGSPFELDLQKKPCPLIIWNHRWEFDKDPASFFSALDRIDKMGVDFRIALMGENYQVEPKAFIKAKERFKDKVVHYGYVDSKAAYNQWLKKGTVVVSTAQQENFGISVIEAIRFGCLPLLPNRLSYPEILPKEFHSQFLYYSQEDLVEKLEQILTNPAHFQIHCPVLSDMMARHAWESRISAYDLELVQLAGRR